MRPRSRAYIGVDFDQIEWWRAAREEFLEAGRGTKTVNQLVSAHVRASIDPANAPSETDEIHSNFDQQLSVLGNLQQAGARESTRGGSNSHTAARNWLRSPIWSEWALRCRLEAYATLQRGCLMTWGCKT